MNFGKIIDELVRGNFQHINLSYKESVELTQKMADELILTVEEMYIRDNWVLMKRRNELEDKLLKENEGEKNETI